MDRFLLPADPAAPLGPLPVAGLVFAQLLAAGALGFLVSLFSDAAGGWVPIVAALSVSQGLGLWWEQHRPGSVTRPRRLRLALLAAAVQGLLGAPLLMFFLPAGELWIVGFALLVALPLHALATWWGIGYGVTLAGRVKKPPTP